ncbi:MAG: aldo/keto reductase [Pirellulales bacterium]
MNCRLLGNTGLSVSAVAFGAGPVPTLLVGDDRRRQIEVVAAALDAGINWFDTAPTYGNGASEQSLGAALRTLDARDVHLASKVRIEPSHAGGLREAVLTIVRSSSKRLGVPRLALLQLHNAITLSDGEMPSSISASRILSSGGVLDAMEAARREGLCSHLGITGIGSPTALREVLSSGRLATAQIPFSIVQPSAGCAVRGPSIDDYDRILADCRRQCIGALAIRVFAGGAITGQPPSEHTKRTPYFPLAAFESDRRRAERIAAALPPDLTIGEAALRFAAHHADVSSAIVGFSSVEQVRQAAQYVAAGPLSHATIDAIIAAASAER